MEKIENKFLDSNEILVEYIKIFLNTSIDYQKFISHVKCDLDLSDSIQHFYPNDDFNILKRDSFRNKEEYVTFALGHISSNPNVRENSFLLNKLYCYATNEICTCEVKPCPNINETTCDKFYLSLLEACDSIRYSVTHGDRVNPHLYYIESERGAGKTIFINHFFNKYNDDLAAKGILWVRMDLDNSVLDSDSVLENYISNKLLKIILKNYSRNSKYDFDFFIREVKERISSNPILEDNFKTVVLNKFSIYINRFHNNNPLQITDQTYDEIIIDTMYQVLKSNNVKIIYIIDNIDLLDKSESRLKKFNLYLNQIKKTFIMNLRENGVFILTYRTNLHNYLTNTISASARTTSPNYYKLCVVSFDEIFKQKIEIIKDRVAVIGKSDIRRWDLSDWPEQINNFYYFIEKLSDFDSIDDFLIFLEAHYHNNNRSKTQIVQLLYQAFVLSYHTRNQYRIIEHLFLSGHRFPPKVFHYSKHNHDLFLDKTDKVYDNIFIPNLFNYPYVKNDPSINLPISDSYLLIKIRLIQLLLGISRSGIEPTNEIAISEVVEYLFGIYGFDERIVLCCLDEFCELEFIELNKKDGGLTARTAKDLIIKPKFNSYFSTIFTTKTKIANVKKVEIFNVFNEIAYLNLCAMRLGFSKNSFDDEPIIKPMPYDLINQSYNSTIEWLKWKIINAVTLTKYIYEIEMFEDNNCLVPDVLPSRLKDVYRNKSAYSIALKVDVIKQMENILTSLNEKDQSNISSEIADHFLKLFGQMNEAIKTAYNKGYNK